MNLTLTAAAPAVQLDLSDYTDLGETGQVLVVQNLGTGDVYFDRFDDVDEDSGVKIAMNGSYEFAIEKVPDLWFMANTSNVDLRFALVG